MTKRVRWVERSETKLINKRLRGPAGFASAQRPCKLDTIQTRDRPYPLTTAIGVISTMISGTAKQATVKSVLAGKSLP